MSSMMEVLDRQADERAAQAPVQVWCDTCEGTGQVHQEPQRGVVGSGGTFACPDCDGRGFNLKTFSVARQKNSLVLAAKAVLERWDSSAWKWDAGAENVDTSTGGLMGALRRAVEAETDDHVSLRTALELMLELYVSLVNSGDCGNWGPETEPAVAAARRALARRPQPEPAPVAWIRRHPDGAFTNELLPAWTIERARRESGAWVPLHAAPQPASQPLTFQQRLALFHGAGDRVSYLGGDWFDLGVKEAERSHGIGSAT